MGINSGRAIHKYSLHFLLGGKEDKRKKNYGCYISNLWSSFRCAPGYYGNPLLIGSTCKKCDCNGNSDPNLIFEDCDEVTGQCRNCLRNTTGFKCERCAPGYYGDARIAKNCAGTVLWILSQLPGQLVCDSSKSSANTEFGWICLGEILQVHPCHFSRAMYILRTVHLKLPGGRYFNQDH